MDTTIKLVDYSQIDETVGQALEIMQLPAEMSDSLFMILCEWLEENDYELTKEN